MNRGFADLRVEPLHHVAPGGRAPNARAAAGLFDLAAPRGFEPRFTDSKSAVLPLDEGAAGAVLEGHPALPGQENGAEDGTRTRDPHLGKVMLYQLSHFRSITRPPPKRWCREPGSNWRHRDFQSRALPTELSRPDGQPGLVARRRPEDSTHSESPSTGHWRPIDPPSRPSVMRQRHRIGASQRPPKPAYVRACRTTWVDCAASSGFDAATASRAPVRPSTRRGQRLERSARCRLLDEARQPPLARVGPLRADHPPDRRCSI